MRIERHYTKPENSPYAEIAFRTTKSEIRNPDGSIVFSLTASRFPRPGVKLPRMCSRKNISAGRGCQPG